MFTLCQGCDDGEVEIDLARRKVASQARHRRGIRAGDHGRRRCYQPIDESLENLKFRILRAICHFDWATPANLSDALNIPTWDTDRQRRGNFDVTMSRLIRLGLIERVGNGPMSYEYRITEAGINEYEFQLARSVAA